MYIYEDSLCSLDTTYINVRGSIKRFLLRNVDVYREDDLPCSGTLPRIEGSTDEVGIEVLSMNDVVTNTLAQLVDYVAGTFENVQVSHIRYDAEESASFSLNGVVNDFQLNSYVDNNPVETGENGQINKLHGDAFATV